MTEQLESVDVEVVRNLKVEMDRMHEAYSDAFRRHEEREGELANVIRQRSSVVAAYKTACRSCRSVLDETVSTLANDPSGGDGVALNAVRSRVELLRLAIQKLSAFDAADAECAAFSARVDELGAQLVFERVRLAHHEATVMQALRGAVELDGSVELKGTGEVSQAMANLVAKIADDLRQARETLRDHQTATTQTRAVYESEARKWTL